MKLLNSIDPTIDPWGMSLVTDLQLDFTTLITNPMSPAAQPAPKCTSLTTCLAHTLSNLSIRMFWETVLKVLLRSRYTSSSALQSFSKAGISSWKVTRLVKHDFPFIICTDYSHSLSRVIHSIFWNGFHVFFCSFPGSDMRLIEVPLLTVNHIAKHSITLTGIPPSQTTRSHGRKGEWHKDSSILLSLYLPIIV